MTPAIKDQVSPVWGLVREFPIFKSELEGVPDIELDSIDSGEPKVLHSMSLSLKQLIIAGKDFNEIPLKSYSFSPSK